jgi:copper chaperone NosL
MRDTPYHAGKTIKIKPFLTFFERRENMLKAFAFALAAAFAASAFAAPAAITPDDQCGGCGMWILKYPGPKAQLAPEGAEPRKFCSVKCSVCTVLREGASKEDLYVHDAETNDWDKPGDHYIPAKDAWFVVGSSKKATMGKSVAPFKTKEAAERFQKEFGGETARFSELTPEVLGCKKPKNNMMPMK